MVLSWIDAEYIGTLAWRRPVRVEKSAPGQRRLRCVKQTCVFVSNVTACYYFFSAGE